MDRIDQGLLETYRSLLDRREMVQFVVPATFRNSNYRTRPPEAVALLVTDKRMILGVPGKEPTDPVVRRGDHDRRTRLRAASMGDHLRSKSNNLDFDVAFEPILEEIDAGAADFDELHDPTLGTWTADARGEYRLGHDVSGMTGLRVRLAGALPEDTLAWCGFVVADRNRFLAEAEQVIVDEFFHPEDGETPRTEEEFRRRLGVLAVEVAGRARLDVYFSDDNMYGGHSLIAQLFDGTRWATQMWG